MDDNSDDDDLELPKIKDTKETINALKKLKNEIQLRKRGFKIMVVKKS